MCGSEISRQTTEQILKHVLALPHGARMIVMAPVVRGRKGEVQQGSGEAGAAGVRRARMDGVIHPLTEPLELDKRKNHTIEVVVDRLLVKAGIEKRLEASIETATKLANGLVLISVVDGEERLYSRKLACVECGTSVPELEPRSFSFNSPYGACETCSGLGSTWAFDPAKIIADPAKPLLEGGLGPGAGSSSIQHRLEAAAKTLRLKLKTPWEQLPRAGREKLLNGEGSFPGLLAILQESYDSASADYREWLTDYMSPVKCTACAGAAAAAVEPGGAGQGRVDRGVHRDADFARAADGAVVGVGGAGGADCRARGGRDPAAAGVSWTVGLDYLSLDRSAATLSGGEAQRIRLATQIGSKLRGVLYVLDEPSIGLHPRDNDRLLDTLTELRDMGNTVLVVEHDEETIRARGLRDRSGAGRGAAGRGAGGLRDAGRHSRKRAESLTGQYLAGTVEIPVPKTRRRGQRQVDWC